MKKIGIMGGTFNPIHIGHLVLAHWAMEAERLDEIWFIPTGQPYMKSMDELVPAEERYRMVSMALEQCPNMRCLDIEVKRPGYTYTYETVETLREQYPDVHFYFISGADCLFSIENWRYPERIFRACTLLVAERDAFRKEEMEAKCSELQQKFHADIKLLPFLRLDISSTDIRSCISQGRSVRFLVPDQVISYIEEKGYYKDEI